MKKFLLVAMCLLTLVCLCACQDDIYKQMNDVLAADYAEIAVSIETTKGSDTLTSSVTVKNSDGKSTVTYRIEKFTEISADQIPDSYKTVHSGTVQIVDGVETGDVLQGISFAKFAYPSYNFRKEYFEKEKFQDGVFTAEVFAPKMFMKDDINCTDMTVEFHYESEQKVLTLCYLENGVSVKVTYTMK